MWKYLVTIKNMLMPKQLPKVILNAAVRHKFYTIIDWKRCSALEKRVLDRELTEGEQFGGNSLGTTTKLN